MKRLTEDILNRLAKDSITTRGAILKATTLAGSGHPGGSMSSIDILLSIYAMANISSSNYYESSRDRVVVSNGHISPAVYSSLALNGFFSLDEFVSRFRLAGSIFEGHVERDTPGIEWGSGNLGQGLSAACGFALASRLKGIDNRVYVIMGDGEQQKGQLSEARRFAVKYKLNNITAFIDYNRLQIGGDIEKIMPQNISENYRSDGWEVIEIDGHSFREIFNAAEQAGQNTSPTMILARTVMGKGVSFMENKEQYHGAAINEEQLEKALSELGLDNDIEELKRMRNEFSLSERSNCAVSEQEVSGGRMFDSKLFVTDKLRVYDKMLDNRSAWGNALSDIAVSAKEKRGDKYVPIAVFDCDLQGSVKTNDFEKILPENFIQCGIAEHHTATVAGSMSIENILAFFADFGVFGVDETYNQHRLNDINHTNLKLIVTHVGLDVGEDGKTHQCLDYVGLMRNLYHFRTIVPVCPNQTDRAVRYISTNKGNHLVAMGRSKVPVIRKEDGTLFYDENYRFEYGKADMLRDGNDGAMLVMGSVASKGVEIVDTLRQKGIKLQLWAVSCPMAVDEEMLKKAAQTERIFTYEDHNVYTGLGSIIADELIKQELNCRLHKFGVEGYCLSGAAGDVYRLAGLDAEGVTAKIEMLLNQ